MISESDQGVAASDAVGVLFFTGDEHDNIPTVFDEGLLELFVNIKIGNDLIALTITLFTIRIRQSRMLTLIFTIQFPT